MRKKPRQQFSLFDAMDSSSQNAPAEKTAEAANSASKKLSRITGHVRLSSLEKIYETLVNGLQKFFDERGFERAVIGLSGGVDSSLTLKIAVDALGAENVTALLLPELGVSKQENIDHAKMLCEFFGVAYFFQPINQFLVDFPRLPWSPSRIAWMNTKARVRAVLLYNFANTDRAMVLGTSNKSEILLGYGTKYGDLAADVEVIGSLFKTEVVKLADFAGLPPEIVNKTPTAELAAGQTDEAELGATYEELDKILIKLELGESGCIADGLPEEIVKLAFKRVKENKHKAELPFVLPI